MKVMDSIVDSGECIHDSARIMASVHIAPGRPAIKTMSHTLESLEAMRYSFT